MVIGTLAVDGWAVTFGTARTGGAPPSPLLAVPLPNVTNDHVTSPKLAELCDRFVIRSVVLL